MAGFHIPRFVQKGDDVVFRSPYSDFSDLYCNKCLTRRLIENYNPIQFRSVSIQCGSCGYTNILLYNDKPAEGKLFIPAPGDYIIGGTVDIPKYIIVADLSVKDSLRYSLAPRQRDSSFSINEKLLTEIRAICDSIIGEKFDRQISYVRRKGYSSASAYPVAFSFSNVSDFLNGSLTGKTFYMGSAVCLYYFKSVVEMWHHHPLFDSFRNDLLKKDSFFHAWGMLSLSFTLFNDNEIVSINPEGGDPGASPDLYMYPNGFGRFYIEAKAPSSLQIFGGRPSEAEVDRVILQSIKKATTQVNSRKRGSILIVSASLDFRLRNHIQKSIRDYLDRWGHTQTSLASIISIYSNLNFLADGTGFRLNNDELYRDVVENTSFIL